MEKFPTLFGNVLEDVEYHFIKLNNDYDIYKVVEDDVAY